MKRRRERRREDAIYRRRGVDREWDAWLADSLEVGLPIRTCLDDLLRLNLVEDSVVARAGVREAVALEIRGGTAKVTPAKERGDEGARRRWDEEARRR